MKQIQLNAAARLNYTIAKAPPATSDWWSHLPAEQKKQYIEEHPQSKYADEAIKDADERDRKEENGEIPKSKKLSPEQRTEVANDIRGRTSKIAGVLKKTFPRITEAGSALKHIATGKPLTSEHKEVLFELGAVALKAATAPAGGPYGAHVLGRMGITAVKHAIDHFKEKKEAAKDKDDVEVFVDAVADGVEKAKEAPIPAEHVKPKSHYRTAIGKHLKGQASHIVSVLNKSFPHVKPATSGLVALSTGKPLTEEHKKAVRGLGKVALGVSIAALPGGLAAHLAAGVGAAALTHAFKAIRKHPIDPKHVMHSFVEAIGEGLEDAILEHAAGGEHGE